LRGNSPCYRHTPSRREQSSSFCAIGTLLGKSLVNQGKSIALFVNSTTIELAVNK
jgi:hypothetical protein